MAKRKTTRGREKRAGATLKNPPQWLYQALGAGVPNTSGISVSEVTALNLSDVWACVRVISETGGILPWFVYRRVGENGRERAPDHEAYSLLHDAPNPDMGAMTWKETMLAHCLLWGNGYSEIVRDPAGRPASLYPITPDRVTVKRLGTGRLVYQVSNGAQAPPTMMDPEDVFHAKGLGFDGLVGYSIVHKARESMGLTAAAEMFGASYFGNGTHSGGALKHPKTLSDKAQKNLRESVEAVHRGAEKAHKFFILEEGMEYVSTSVPPNDSQFLETRQFQVEEICRWFRVQPHKVQHLLRSTFSNIEHQSIEFVQDTITPWLVRMEQEANRKLIRPIDRATYYTEHLVDALLRGDAAARAQALEIQFRNGTLTPNEWRAIENRNPMPDEDGNKSFVALNMTPIDRIDEFIDAQIQGIRPAAQRSAQPRPNATGEAS